MGLFALAVLNASLAAPYLDENNPNFADDKALYFFLYSVIVDDVPVVTEQRYDDITMTSWSHEVPDGGKKFRVELKACRTFACSVPAFDQEVAPGKPGKITARLQ